MATAKPATALRKYLFVTNPNPVLAFDPRSLRIKAANNAAIALYGHSLREFRSMTLGELRPTGEAPCLDRPLTLGPGAAARPLWTHITRRGRRFTAELRVLAMPGSRRLRLLSIMDTAPCSHSRGMLVYSERMQRSLVEECPFGILRMNLTSGRCEHANPALLRMLGYTLDEFLNLNEASFFREADSRNRLLAAARLNGVVRDLETWIAAKGGHSIRVSLSAYLTRSARREDEYLHAYVRSVSYQRELELQLCETQRLRSADYIADEASHSVNPSPALPVANLPAAKPVAPDGEALHMDAMGRLAGGIAHDFNNITQSITLSCELALHGPLSAELQSKLTGILQQATRAAEITQQLLAFSRRQILRPQAVNLNDCLRQSLPVLQHFFGGGISIEMRLDESITPVLVDSDQLSTVLLQLADNARSAMPNGGRLEISTSWEVRIPNLSDPWCGESGVVLTFADSGVGMDEVTRSRIFEPFFSTKPPATSAGLGLSTVHGIIHQSHGRIECTSAPGAGTTFRIVLPTPTPQSHQPCFSHAEQPC
jgi:two-component system cell cycle sensor histidine kinase/response regulator CckA